MIKNAFRWILPVALLMLLAACALAEETADSLFLRDLAAGLDERWAYIDTVDESALSGEAFYNYRIKAVRFEYDRLQKYANGPFLDSDLQQLAAAYIQALEEQLAAMEDYGRASFSSRWLDSANQRSLYVWKIFKKYGVAAKDRIALNTFIATGERLEANEILQSMAEGLVFTYIQDKALGSFYFHADVQNTTSIPFTQVDFNAQLLDGEGRYLAPAPIGTSPVSETDAWKPRERISLEFMDLSSMNQKLDRPAFSKMKIEVSCYDLDGHAYTAGAVLDHPYTAGAPAVPYGGQAVQAPESTPVKEEALLAFPFDLFRQRFAQEGQNLFSCGAVKQDSKRFWKLKFTPQKDADFLYGDVVFFKEEYMDECTSVTVSAVYPNTSGDFDGWASSLKEAADLQATEKFRGFIDVSRCFIQTLSPKAGDAEADEVILRAIQLGASSEYAYQLFGYEETDDERYGKGVAFPQTGGWEFYYLNGGNWLQLTARRAGQ